MKRTGQKDKGQVTETDRPGTAKPNSGRVLLPSGAKGQFPLQFGLHHSSSDFFFPALFHKICNQRKEKQKRRK